MKRELWEYSKRPKAPIRIMSLGFILDVISILYGLVLVFRLGTSESLLFNVFTSLEAIGSIGLGVYNMGQYAAIMLLNRTIEYRITENGIRFEWGFIWKDNYFLNFENINTITLLEDDMDIGSILFHSTETPGFTGYDWKNKVFRSMPSIERIENVQSIFNLILHKWHEVTKDSPLEGLEEEVINQQINEGVLQKKWTFNRNIGRTYGLIFLITTLFFIDNRILEDIPVSDKVEWIDTRMNTEKGYSFRRVRDLMKGSDVKLVVSPVYGKVKSVTWLEQNVEVKKKYGLWGPPMFFYFFTWLLLLIASLSILVKRGKIDASMEPSFVLGPSGLLFISLLFYYTIN